MMKKISDLIELKTVLISVHDTKGLDALVAGLFERCPGAVIYASSSCYQAIKELMPREKVWNNLLSLGQLTRDMEIEGTSFEVLHSQVFLGIASRPYSDQHQKLARGRHTPLIDLVIANLQPLAASPAPGGFDTVMDSIDIPGQAILSLACSNPCQVAAISDPRRYGDLLEEIDMFRGRTSLSFRLRMAQESSSYLQNYGSKASSFLKGASCGDIETCFEVSDRSEDFLEKIRQEEAAAAK